MLLIFFNNMGPLISLPAINLHVTKLLAQMILNEFSGHHDVIFGQTLFFFLCYALYAKGKPFPRPLNKAFSPSLVPNVSHLTWCSFSSPLSSWLSNLASCALKNPLSSSIVNFVRFFDSSMAASTWLYFGPRLTRTLLTTITFDRMSPWHLIWFTNSITLLIYPSTLYCVWCPNFETLP